MKRSSLIIAAVVTMAIVLGTSGCVMGQTIALNADNSGIAATDLVVDEFFIAVLEDFQAFEPERKDQTIMDASVESFNKGMAAKQSVSQVKSAKLGPTSYVVSFSFSDLNRFMLEMNEMKSQSLLNVTAAGNRTTFSISLNMQTYPQLTKLIPFLADPNFETFGPLYNEGMSEADYLDMISYILGEEGPPAITQSTIILLLEVPRPIISVNGGTLLGTRTARLEIPLIDFLLLAKPIEFNVTW